MTRTFAGGLVPVLCLISLAGCSGSFSVAKFDAPSSPVSDDLPAAQPLDTGRSRILFLIIVEQLHRSGRSRAALAYIADYDRVYPNDPRAALLHADCLVATGQYREAEALYQRLLHGDRAAEAEAGLGHVAASAGDWKAATARFREASRLNSANPDYLNDLGYAQTAAGSYEQALASLRQAYELEAGSRTIRNNLILALHLSGQEAEARAMIDRIAQPDDRRDAAGLLHLTAAGLRPAPDASSSPAASASEAGGVTLARLVPAAAP